jgi:hypothetical protein
MTQEYATVATASGMMEAEILKGMLQAQGVTVWLRHESAGSAIGLGVGPLALVDICVPLDQESEALAVLEDYSSGALEIDDEDKN